MKNLYLSIKLEKYMEIIQVGEKNWNIIITEYSYQYKIAA
jgi:hypothetical protein